MIQLDVTSASSVKLYVAELLEAFQGKLDILINNAGAIIPEAIEEMSEEDTINQFETNLFGAMRVTKEVLPTMRAQKSGRIVIIGSLADTSQFPFRDCMQQQSLLSRDTPNRSGRKQKILGKHVSIDESSFLKANIVSFGKPAGRSNSDVIITTQNLEDSKLAEHHYRMEESRLEKIF